MESIQTDQLQYLLLLRFAYIHEDACMCAAGSHKGAWHLPLPKETSIDMDCVQHIGMKAGARQTELPDPTKS
jgi:hypothetical protein